MFILHAEEMNKLDEFAIGHIGILQCVLMERAALGVADCILKQFENPSVLVLSGPGNCGGDGLALARILLDKGIKVDAYLPAAIEKCKESIQNEAGYFQAFGGELLKELPEKTYDIIVDAVFGIGLNRPVKDAFLEAIEWVNSQKEKTQAHVISIDIPSGIHTDTGSVLGAAVKADETVTFSYLKPGLLLHPGKEYAGKISVSSIGIDSLEVPDIKKNIFTYELSGTNVDQVRLKKRRPDGNKGTFKRILIIAGSKEMAGAALLCSESALRSGAGLVELYTHEANRDLVLSSLPEVILHTHDGISGHKDKINWTALEAFAEKDEAAEIIRDRIILGDMFSRTDVVVIGPGLSKSSYAKFMVEESVLNCSKPLVLDADGINLISEEDRLKTFLKKRQGNGLVTVLTPHPAELSRLSGLSVSELLSDYERYVKQIAEEYGVILVGKGATTIVSDGKDVYYNLSGNDGMATAGSGDVLAGMIGAFLLNENTCFDGVCKAVYVHGKAGDVIAEETGHRGMLAGDIICGLKLLEE